MANFTKPAIKASFMKLLNERPLNKISVRDIVEDCGINRNSFYYHFQDIPSLLGEIIEDETERLIQEYSSVSSLDECFYAAFRFLQENKRAVMHIYDSVNREMLTKNALRRCEYVVSSYIDTVYPDVRICQTDKQIVIRFIGCQLYGMCVDWIEHGMTDSAYDDLRRMLELVRDLPELIVRRSTETSAV